jgi:hypothetical protein
MRKGSPEKASKTAAIKKTARSRQKSSGSTQPQKNEYQKNTDDLMKEDKTEKCLLVWVQAI